MGDRGQILIKDTGVYLYSHWGAIDLWGEAWRALKRAPDRWDDPEYLARVIFSEMVRNDIDSTTGFGIGTNVHDDTWRLIEVDCSKTKITLNDYKEVKLTKTFDEFTKMSVDEIEKEITGQVCQVCQSPQDGCECTCPKCGSHCFDDVTLADHTLCYGCHKEKLNGA